MFRRKVLVWISDGCSHLNTGHYEGFIIKEDESRYLVRFRNKLLEDMWLLKENVELL